MDYKLVITLLALVAFSGFTAAEIQESELSENYVQSDTSIDFSATIDETDSNVNDISIEVDTETYTLTEENGEYTTSFNAPLAEGDYSPTLTVEYDDDTSDTQNYDLTVSDSVEITSTDIFNTEDVNDDQLAMDGDQIRIEANVDEDSENIVEVTINDQSMTEGTENWFFEDSYDSSLVLYDIVVEDEAGNTDDVTVDNLEENLVPQLSNGKIEIDFDSSESVFTIELDDRGQEVSVNHGIIEGDTVTVENQNNFVLEVEDGYGAVEEFEVAISKEFSDRFSSGEHTIDEQEFTQEIEILNSGDSIEVEAEKGSFLEELEVVDENKDSQIIEANNQITLENNYVVDVLNLVRGSLEVDSDFSNDLNTQRIIQTDTVEVDNAIDFDISVFVDGDREDFGNQTVTVQEDTDVEFSNQANYVVVEHSDRVIQDDSQTSTQNEQYFINQDMVTLSTDLEVPEFVLDGEESQDTLLVPGGEYVLSQEGETDDRVSVEEGELKEGDFDHTINEQEITQEVNITNNDIEMEIDIIPPEIFQDEYGDSTVTLDVGETHTETYSMAGDWLEETEEGIENELDVQFSSVSLENGEEIDVAPSEVRDIGQDRIEAVGNFFGSPTGLVASLIAILMIGGFLVLRN